MQRSKYFGAEERAVLFSSLKEEMDDRVFLFLKFIHKKVVVFFSAQRDGGWWNIFVMYALVFYE
jgi:hypothetical protein